MVHQKSTIVKYGQKDVFFYHVNTFTFEKRRKFICVHKQCFDITTFINTYVGLRYSSIVHSNGFVALWHSWILKFIILQWLSHISFHHVVRIFFIYIVVWQKKWFKPSTFYILMWNVMSHCHVYQCLHFTVTLSRVISHYDVKPWFVIVFGWYMLT